MTVLLLEKHCLYIVFESVCWNYTFTASQLPLLQTINSSKQFPEKAQWSCASELSIVLATEVHIQPASVLISFSSHQLPVVRAPQSLWVSTVSCSAQCEAASLENAAMHKFFLFFLNKSLGSVKQSAKQKRKSSKVSYLPCFHRTLGTPVMRTWRGLHALTEREKKRRNCKLKFVN